MPVKLDPKTAICVPPLHAMFVQKRTLTQSKRQTIAVANVHQGVGVIVGATDMFYYVAHYDGDPDLAEARLNQHLETLDSYTAGKTLDMAAVVGLDMQSPLCKRLKKALKAKQKGLKISETKAPGLSYFYRDKGPQPANGTLFIPVGHKAQFEKCRELARSIWTLTGDHTAKNTTVYHEGKAHSFVAGTFDDKFLAKFYAAIAHTPAKFQKMLDDALFPAFAKASGGAKKPGSSITPALQEAVNALTIYIKGGYPKADEKMAFFVKTFMRTFPKGALPNADGTITVHAKRLDLVEAKYNLIMSKFRIIDHWEMVAEEKTKERWYAGDEEYWFFDEVFNFDPISVRMVMECLLEDVQELLHKDHLTKEMETWRGCKSTGTLTYTHDDFVRSLNGKALAAIGGEIKGKFELKYEGFKLTGDVSAFTGARAAGNLEAGKKKGKGKETKVKADASVEVGIIIKGNLNLDLGSTLKASAGTVAMAGALAKANVELLVDGSRIKVAGGAEVFAGARLQGTAKSTFLIDGRSVLKAKAKAGVSAGAGVTAKGGFECDIFGKTKLSGKFGATLGVGAEGGGSIEFDGHNLWWGLANLFYAAASDFHINRKRKWLLPVEENIGLGKKTKTQLMEYLTQLTTESRDEWIRLEQWRALETKIRALVITKNDDLAKLKPGDMVWI